MSTQKLIEVARQLEPAMGVEQVDALLHVAAPRAVEVVPGLCRHSPTKVAEVPDEVEFDVWRIAANHFTDFDL